jgi:hypothetical protein
MPRNDLRSFGLSENHLIKLINATVGCLLPVILRRMIFMKKLIAIAVVFVLAVGVAFAADIAAQVIGNITPIQGSSEDGSDVITGGSFGQIRLSASGQNDDGNFGGWFRLQGAWGNGGSQAYYYDDGNSATTNDVGWWNLRINGVSTWGLVWWKPLDILKVQFGANPDGHFDGVDGVTRWGFYRIACDVGVAKESFDTTAFFGGYSAPGLFLTLAPIEPLAINVAVPFIDQMYKDNKAETVYKKLVAQVTYDIGGIGKVAVSYQGDLNELKGNDAADASKLWGFFQLTAVENLDLHLGVGYYVPVTDDVTINGKAEKVTVSKNVGLGLGVNFTTGALGIKARVIGAFGGNVKGGLADGKKEDTTLTADLLPSFDISDKVSAYLDTGLKMTKPDGSDAQVGWHIMPYVAVKANWWAPNFYAGFRFESEGKKAGGPDAIVNWSVPIGMILEF